MRRKNEERAVANKKLKELGILDTDGPKISNRERSIAYDHSLKDKSTSRRGSAPLPILTESPGVANNVERMEGLLDQEIDKLLKMKEAKTSKDKQVGQSYLLGWFCFWSEDIFFQEFRIKIRSCKLEYQKPRKMKGVI